MLERRFEHVTPHFLTFSVCKFIARLFKIKIKYCKSVALHPDKQTNVCFLVDIQLKKLAKRLKLKPGFYFNGLKPGLWTFFSKFSQSRI